MKLSSESITDGAPMPGEFAFCVQDPNTHVTFAPNRNPHLMWDDVPEGTRSFCVLCVDPNVPSVGDDVNQEGKSVPADLPRVDFAHWVLIDLPPCARSLAAGAHSDGVTPRGKGGPTAADGGRHGVNDYTGWFAGDADMGGDYYGYDGPCPPWNDELVHDYVFSAYALDVPTLAVQGRFGLAEVREAMKGHILGEASITATYTLNPKLSG